MIIQGTLLGGLYALFAIGLSLAFGIMRLVNIAHGDLIVLSAYAALLVVNGLGVDPMISLAVVMPLMFALGLAPLVVLLYWMWRIRLRKSLRGLIVGTRDIATSPSAS